MNFDLSDLQRMLLDSAERYLGDRFTLEQRRSLRHKDTGLDSEAWETFAELGWLAILVPEEMGGVGGDMADAVVLASALGAQCVAQPFASSAVLGATILAGAPSASADLLGELAAGTVRIALAHTEPGEGHVGEQMRKVSLKADGAGLLLDGQKMLVCDAASATHLVATAQGPAGLTLLLLPANHAGISYDHYPLLDGTRAADIAFASVSVPCDAVLAEGEQAEELLALALDRTRLIHLAQAVGSVEAMLKICSAYLKERQQFGQPIGNFQSLQHIMADMFVAAHQARSILYFALAQIGEPPAQRRRALALAQVNIGEAAQLVSRQAIQLHGGYGVTDEYEVSHHYRRQLVLEKLYGGIDHALLLAEA